jgi:hypothetical protein
MKFHILLLLLIIPLVYGSLDDNERDDLKSNYGITTEDGAYMEGDTAYITGDASIDSLQGNVVLYGGSVYITSSTSGSMSIESGRVTDAKGNTHTFTSAKEIIITDGVITGMDDADYQGDLDEHAIKGMIDYEEGVVTSNLVTIGGTMEISGTDVDITLGDTISIGEGVDKKEDINIQYDDSFEKFRLHNEDGTKMVDEGVTFQGVNGFEQSYYFDNGPSEKFGVIKESLIGFYDRMPVPFKFIGDPILGFQEVDREGRFDAKLKFTPKSDGVSIDFTFTGNPLSAQPVKAIYHLGGDTVQHIGKIVTYPGRKVKALFIRRRGRD